MNEEPDNCTAFSVKPGFPTACLPMSSTSFDILIPTSLNENLGKPSAGTNELIIQCAFPKHKQNDAYILKLTLPRGLLFQVLVSQWDIQHFLVGSGLLTFGSILRSYQNSSLPPAPCVVALVFLPQVGSGAVLSPMCLFFLQRPKRSHISRAPVAC